MAPKLYFEVYVKNEPMLFIHENGGIIDSIENQIEYLKNKYIVSLSITEIRKF